MNVRKTIILALFAAITLIPAVAAGKHDKKVAKTSGTLEAIKARDKLIIGVFGDKPPFGYIDEKGNNVGYDIAFGRRFAKDLLGDERKVEFVTLEAANRIEYLKSNKVDIILANFTVTPSRKEEVDFALPYMKVALGIVAPNASSVKSIADLKGKTLIVDKGTTAELFFTEKYPEIKLLKFDQNTEAFQALKDGRGDALAHDNTLLFAWAFETPGFKVVEGSLGGQDTIAPAVKKGNASLLAWLNDELTKLGKENFAHAAFDAELKAHFSPDTKADDVVIEGGVLK
jgi:polar amino acid transport system substrate-binding protein